LIDETKLLIQLKERYCAELSRESPFNDFTELSPNIREAIHEIQYLADSYDPWMIYVYGFCLEVGFGVHRNVYKAVEFYQKASVRLPQAQYLYSLCLRDGVEITRDFQSAFYYLRQAADAQDSDTQYDLAVCLALGIGGMKD
jgi:TPR repeat protein